MAIYICSRPQRATWLVTCSQFNQYAPLETFIVTILHFTDSCFAELDFHHTLNIISSLISLVGLNDPLLHLEMSIL